MKKHLLSCFLLLTLCKINGQEFVYENYIPKWANISNDSTYIGHSENNNPLGTTYQFNGKNHLLPLTDAILFEDKILSIFVNHKNDFQGGRIEVRNIQNGQLIWRYNFDLRSETAREYPASFRINENNDLELVCFRSTVENNYFLLWDRAHLSIRTFDVNSGHLKTSIFKELTDPDDLEFYPGLSRLIYRDGNYDYIKYHCDDSYYNYSIESFNTELEKTGSDSIKQPKKYQYYAYYQAQLSENLKFVTRFSANEASPTSPPSLYEYKIDIYDNQWTLMDTKDLSESIDSASQYDYLNFENGHHIFNAAININEETPPVNKIMVYDGQFNKKETIQLPEIKYSKINVHKLKYKDGVVIIAPSNLGKFNIYKTNGAGVIDKSISLTIPPKFVFYGLKSLFIEDNLLFVSFVKREIEQNGFPDAEKDELVTLLIDLIELGIITNTEEEIRQTDFVVSPNPTTHELNVKSDYLYDQVNIYDCTGQKIISSKSIESIDVSNLQNGLYIAEILKNGISLSKQKFIKIE